MSESDQAARIEALESRLAHQELAIEELTRTLLAQERLLREQDETLRRLQLQLQQLSERMPGQVGEERPPHY
ncbi:SlyX family protein [Thiohalobacter sp. IOR34]|uniref:SlyX family protein n=1 Tax=Thiohalobacter sp. IOR34 TaxID=3057176 RepID=UPI0025B1E69C|nr:SlyX family protein [Thiohalobacter sp. IOR34]WJW75395.1 SlyX family protein [Thiohalobacter sp. IOR34]